MAVNKSAVESQPAQTLLCCGQLDFDCAGCCCSTAIAAHCSSDHTHTGIPLDCVIENPIAAHEQACVLLVGHTGCSCHADQTRRQCKIVKCTDMLISVHDSKQCQATYLLSNPSMFTVYSSTMSTTDNVITTRRSMEALDIHFSFIAKECGPVNHYKLSPKSIHSKGAEQQ